MNTTTTQPRQVSAWNAAPLASVTDTSATFGAITLDALDGDTLAGLGAMVDTALQIGPSKLGVTERGNRRLCVCKQRVAEAIARRGGMAGVSARPLAQIIVNPVARKSRSLYSSAAGSSLMQSDSLGVASNGFSGWSSNATGVGATSRNTAANIATAAESAAEGMGSWLSHALRSGSIGPIAGIVASFIPGVGPVVGAAIAAAASAASSSGSAPAGTTAARAPTAAERAASAQAQQNAQLARSNLTSSGTPAVYEPTSPRPADAPAQTFGIDNKTLMIGGGVAVLGLIALFALKK